MRPSFYLFLGDMLSRISMCVVSNQERKNNFLLGNKKPKLLQIVFQKADERLYLKNRT